MRNPLRLATRGSQLALWQARMVAEKIRRLAPDQEVELVLVKTTGDVRQETPLAEMAGKGIFIREIEAALLRDDAHIAVHSAKDLPSVETPQLVLAAFCERHDPRDALITGITGHGSWETLPEGASVATSAPRRIAQLRHRRPDLRFVAIRGNVDTRLSRLDRGEADALVLAVAGLERLGFGARITERLPLELSLPQVGQGCVAVQCRERDSELQELLAAACDHSPTRLAVTAERAFLALLGGGCTAPVAAYAWLEGETLRLTARVLTEDGARLLESSEVLELTRTDNPASAALLGEKVYQALLKQGAAGLMA